MIFVLPWLGQTLIGTTDNDYEGDIDHVRPADEDVAYLLEAVNAFFATDIVAEDIAGAYAGVRPLISTGDPKKSVDISRKAELYETSSGMVTITGGKLTTWRRMAKMTVDRLVERDGRDAPCRTGEIPLGMPVDANELTRVEGVGEEAYEQLAGRYGFAAHDVLTTAAERGELAQPILPGMPDLLAEAAFSARREQARSVSDVLLRRTRLGLTAARRLCAPGEQAPERVARALGAELGWDDARCAAEAERFRADAVGGGARGRLRDCRRARAVTFRSSAGCTDRSRHRPLEPCRVHVPPPQPVRPARPAGPRRRCPPRASAGWFPAQPVDGPSPDIEKLGGVDLARDGTGGLVYLKRVDGAPHVFLSRFNGGQFRPPERVDNGLGAGATEAAIAAADAGRLAVVWTAGSRVYGCVVAGNDKQPGPLLGPTELYNDPGGPSTDIAIDMGINGAAYAPWAGAGRRRLGRPRRAPDGRRRGRRSARRWTSTPRRPRAAAPSARASASRPRATRS